MLAERDAGDSCPGADLHLTRRAVIAAIGVACDLLLVIAEPVGIGVAADDADEPTVEIGAAGAVHHEVDRPAGLGAPAVGISNEIRQHAKTSNRLGVAN